MEKVKLTIDQLKNYLGTDLKIKVPLRREERKYTSERYCTLDCISLKERYKIWTRDQNLLGPLNIIGRGFRISQVKPVCYKLSDLDKFIPELGFVPLQEIFQIIYKSIYKHRFEGEFNPNPELGVNLAVEAKETVLLDEYFYGMTVEIPNQCLFSVNGGYCTVPNFEVYQKLFQWHFWPFDQEYFEQGLVIDKMKEGRNA